jgi:hypothetical protein
VKRGNHFAPGVAISLCLAASLLFLGLEAPSASAQVLYGSIVGTLTDPSGAGVSKVTVTVTNTSAGLSRQSSTDEVGYYAIPNLPPGAYDLSVSAPGFKPVTQRASTFSSIP